MSVEVDTCDVTSDPTISATCSSNGTWRCRRDPAVSILVVRAWDFADDVAALDGSA